MKPKRNQVSPKSPCPGSWRVLATLGQLLAAPRSSIDDPNIRPRQDFKGARTFMLVEEEVGELDGYTGYWVEEEETGLEGFLAEFEDEWREYTGAEDTQYTYCKNISLPLLSESTCKCEHEKMTMSYIFRTELAATYPLATIHIVTQG